MAKQQDQGNGTLRPGDSAVFGMSQPSQWIPLLLRWLLGRDISTILLAIIIFGGYRASVWLVDVGVPAYINHIDKGYQALDARHVKEYAMQREAFLNEVERSRQQYMADRERDREFIRRYEELLRRSTHGASLSFPNDE